MRIWRGTFSLLKKRGRNWNIGVHVYEDEKIGHQAVIRITRKALATKLAEIDSLVKSILA